MSPWFVYILRCRDKSLYTGISNHLEERVAKHNAGTGSKYTRSHRPVKLVWKERKKNESSAKKREAEIKGWTKMKKEKLIKIRKKVAHEKV